MAHQRARTVNNARAGARCCSTSANVPVGQTRWTQRQVRLRQITTTGRAKQGTSIKRCSRRPWLYAITAHEGQPTGPGGGDSTVICNRPAPASTAMTWKPSSPTSTSQRSQYPAPSRATEGQGGAVGSAMSRSSLEQVAWSLLILRASTPTPHTTPDATAPEQPPHHRYEEPL